jgi:hypothetical protein
MIIKEGRKEEVYKKYEYPIRIERGLNAFIEPVSFYDIVIEEPFFENTGFKYLEPVIKNYYKDKNYKINDKPFTVPESRDFLSKSRKDVQDIKNSLEFFDIHNSKYKFKDFNQYVNKNMLTDFFTETVKLRDKYESKNQQRLAKKQSEKIYEDKDLVVVKPMSYEASCYYGAGTRWCTTRKNENIHFSNYGKTMGRLYYFIFKDKTISDPMYKVATFFKFTPSEKQKINYDDISVYNAKDDLLDFQQKTSFFSELPSGLFETIVKNFEEDQSKNASSNQLVRDSISEFESRRSNVSHDFNYLGDKVRIEFGNLVDMSDQNIEFKCNYEITVDNNPKLYSSGKVYIAIAMSTMDVLLTFYPDSDNTFNFIKKGDTHETKLNFVPKYYRAPSFIIHDMLKELSEMMSELILQTRPI